MSNFSHRLHQVLYLEPMISVPVQGATIRGYGGGAASVGLWV